MAWTRVGVAEKEEAASKVHYLELEEVWSLPLMRM
jgi:hypothetical protein